MDAVDQDILRIMVMKGCTSGYAIWSQMKRENENVMAYKNVGRRVLLLQKHGIINEIKLPDADNVHWRKDYVLTMKGLEQLIPYFIHHPRDVLKLVNYMNKFNIDKDPFWDSLYQRIHSAADLLTEYAKHTNLPGIGGLGVQFADISHDIRKSTVGSDKSKSSKIKRLDQLESIPEIDELGIAIVDATIALQNLTNDLNGVSTKLKENGVKENMYKEIEELLQTQKGYTGKTIRETINEINETKETIRVVLEKMRDTSSKVIENVRSNRKKKLT